LELRGIAERDCGAAEAVVDMDAVAGGVGDVTQFVVDVGEEFVQIV
jgi:hypothetical protein